MATPSHHPTTHATWSLTGPTGYWRISGLALAVIAALGALMNIALGESAYLISEAFLAFDWTHNVVHVALAAIALTFGFTAIKQATAARAAVVVGAIYLALGIAGFVSPGLFGVGEAIGLHLELGENVIHVALGAWGVLVGRR